MAAIAEIPILAEPVPTKKARSRKALKQKNPSSNETNIFVGTLIESSPSAAAPPDNSVGKENHKSLSQPKSHKKTKKGASKAKQQQLSDVSSFEKELQEMQEKLDKLKIEKEQTEEMLKQKEEELEIRDKEQEKLKIELKKLQKMKEFKPTMALSIGLSLKDQDHEKKEKKKVDPSKKRPSPPYVLWCKDHWNEVKNANPEAEFKDISTILGAKWKTVTAKEKKPYEDIYQAEKEAYLKIVGNKKREHEAMKLLEDEQKQKTAIDLLDQYLQFKQEAEKENNKKSKKVKDLLKPKHPMSAYFIYVNERRAALRADNKSVLEVAKITGEEWKNMTDSQRSPYEQVAMKNKEQYMQEMEVYNKNKEEEIANLKKEEEELNKLTKQEAMQLLKKKEKTDNLIKKTKAQKQKGKKNVDPNKPKKPASSFLIFSKETRKSIAEERPGTSSSTVNALISVKWKELSEEEKQIWNSRAAEGMEAYKNELEVYNKKLAAEEEAQNNKNAVRDCID